MTLFIFDFPRQRISCHTSILLKIFWIFRIFDQKYDFLIFWPKIPWKTMFFAVFVIKIQTNGWCAFCSKNGQKRSKFEISSLNPKTAWEKVSENVLTSNFTIWDVWIKPRWGDLGAPWSGPFDFKGVLTMLSTLWWIYKKVHHWRFDPIW